MSRRLRLAARAAFPFLVLFCWTPAQGLGTERIGVLPFAPLSGDVPAGAGDKGAEILQKALKTQSEFEVVPRQDTAVAAGAPLLSQARQKLAEARAAVAAHRGSVAATAYRAALSADALAVATLDSFDEVIDANAELGTLLYRMGQDDEGQRAIFEALRLAAGQPLKVLAGSPTFAATAEALQKRVAQLGKGSVRVESTPTGADVYVDGQAAGKAPVLLRDLPAGRHYLRALLPSGDTWGAVVEVAPKSEPHLRAQSGAAGPSGEVGGQLAENNLQPSVLAALKKAAAEQKVAFLVLGALHRTLNGLALDPFLYDQARGKVTRLKRVAFDAELLEAGLQMDKVVAEIQKQVGGDAPPLPLPAKAAPDLAAERELATEFHFGGTPDAPLDGAPAAAPGAGDEATQESGRRVITKEPRDSE